MTAERERGLPFGERKLKEEVDKYFEECARAASPPTPSGLALALGVRTSALSGKQLSAGERKIIDRAMQRIEASMMELMLTRGGVKGMESVLERVKESEEGKRAQEELRGMSDEEICQKLRTLAARIGRMIGTQSEEA